MDLLPAEERAAALERIVKRLRWRGPVFAISALTGEGCEALMQAVGNYLAQQQNEAVT
jgi:GTP-binding protein